MGKPFSLRRAAVAAVLFVAACSTPPTTGDVPTTDGTDSIDRVAVMETGTDTIVVDDTPNTDVPGDSSSACAVDSDCYDMLFCNGLERCMPGAAGADARGCVAASPANPCSAGQTCNETTDRCEMCAGTSDMDGDGHRSAACGGDDCDDNDANRFPGNTEVCDSRSHDEDCDGATFGFRDADGDSYADARCCNVDDAGMMQCGDDCNDMRPNVHPALVETCDGLDNDCNGMIDDGVMQTLYVDNDHDGYGDPSMPTMSGCSPPMGYANMPGDCDDTVASVHRGALELCDAAMVDEDCDGVANPPTLCMCSGDITRPCMMSGACAAGTERCVSGSWGACSIAPIAEMCNGVDDNCDGMTDEGLTVTCYADADNDGLAAAGTAPVQSCPVTGRPGVGGCPTNQTNVAPTAGRIDCNDMASNVSPDAPEVCDTAMVDENCDGIANPPSMCSCTGSAMRMCPLPGVCAAGNQTCSGGSWGACSIMPQSETCNGVDDNCNGMTDEMLTVTCYVDSDNDGYAMMGAASAPFCPVTGRDTVGGCPANQTNRVPTSATSADCDDTNAAVNPGATELCDAPMLDENCDGSANPPTLCQCSGTAMRNCPLPGVCSAGTQTCSAGQWSQCSIAAGTETCDGFDNNCDGAVDEGLTITCYPDADNDTYPLGTAAATQVCPDATRTTVGQCPNNYTNRAPAPGAIDCIDTDPTRNPGRMEVCDGVDNDCDGTIDVGLTATFYRDADGDSFGNATVSQTGCTAPAGYVSNNTDCDDTRVAVHPGAPELCDAIDNNCNMMVDEGAMPVNFYRDADGDGYGVVGGTPMNSCTQPAGYVANNTDCDDTRMAVHPGNPEVCNGVDDNCDGMIDEGVAVTYYPDSDADGYGNQAMATVACMRPLGYITMGGDCNDSSATVHPGAADPCNRVDDDCSSGGGVDLTEDRDGDHYAPMTATCTGGYPRTDCNDNDSMVHPTAAETCNGVDNDCDGVVDDGAPCAAGSGCRFGACRVTPTQICVGDAYGCVVRSNRTIACWGSNAYGNLGNGTTTGSSDPVQVNTITDASQVACGEDTACARRGGTVTCWGRGLGGELGDGTTTTMRTAPGASVTGISNATDLQAGYGEFCAIRSAATSPSCWGANYCGGAVRTSPAVEVTSGTSVASMRGSGGASGNYSCAGGSAGATCVGANTSGQLGIAAGACQTTVATVSGGHTGFTSMAQGNGHTCGVLSDGTVWCWGGNGLGQLGNRTVTSSATPVQAYGVAGAVEVVATGNGTCARLSSGTVMCWGGRSSTTRTTTPTAVPGLTDAVSIAMGDTGSIGAAHACAVESSGYVVCWDPGTAASMTSSMTTVANL